MSKAATTTLHSSKASTLLPYRFNNLLLAEIHPGREQKFSRNFYYFLRRERIFRQLGHLYKDAEGTDWFGFIDENDWFTGCRMAEILCLGSSARAGAHPPSQIKGLVLVEDFWPLYRKIGRCAVDREHSMHFVRADSRYTIESDTRCCNWCGKQQHRARETAVVTREHWE
jgi:hypothetical protein